MENDGKRKVHTRSVGILLPREREKKFREQAEEEKQARIQGQWQ